MRLRNGDRALEFEGTLLGEATSDDGRAQRWTIIRIYRVSDGRYVFEKVGRSAVYHRVGGPCNAGTKMDPRQAFELHPDEAILPCLNCDPADVYDTDGDISMETDRCEATVLGSAASVIGYAHMQDDDGVRFLSKVARKAIEAAAAHDADLRDNWMVERL